MLRRKKAYLIAASLVVAALVVAFGGRAFWDRSSASPEGSPSEGVEWPPLPSQTPEMQPTPPATSPAVRATSAPEEGVEWPPGRGTTTPEIRYGVTPATTFTVVVTITPEDLCRYMHEELASVQEDVDRARVQAGDEAAQWLKDTVENRIREKYVGRIAALRGLDPNTDLDVLCPP